MQKYFRVSFTVLIVVDNVVVSSISIGISVVSRFSVVVDGVIFVNIMGFDCIVESG